MQEKHFDIKKHRVWSKLISCKPSDKLFFTGSCCNDAVLLNYVLERNNIQTKRIYVYQL